MERKTWMVTIADADGAQDKVFVWATTPGRAELIALGTRPDGWTIIGDPEEFVAAPEA